MAFNKSLLLSVFVISLSFVENAPSNPIYKIIANDLHSRLVFQSRHGDTSNSNSQPAKQWSTATPVLQKRRLASEEQLTGLVFTPNDTPQDVNKQILAKTDLTRMDDERQNWGLVIDDKDLTEEESYYNRPLNLPKVVVNKVNVTKPAKVGIKAPTAANGLKQPSACDTAVITCCAKPSTLEQCFVSVGCPNVKDFTKLCSIDNIKKVIQEFTRYYKGADNK